MSRSNNGAGNDRREVWQESDDPCGYMTDTPNADHVNINNSVGAALQRCTEIDESDVDTSVKARAWRVYNLARELAATANKMTEPELGLLSARVRKVVDSL
jgi:hypothetical protein